MSLERPSSRPRAEQAPSVAPPENDLKELSPNELRTKLKAIVVDIEELAEHAARDRAERSLTASAESMKGVKGFFKKMWKHGLAREYYRQRELAAARRDIHEKGDIYSAEDPAVAKEAHERAMKAVVERFSHEYDETLHEGETRRKLGDRMGDSRLTSEAADVKHSLKSLVEEYAGGNMSDSDFIEAKKRVLGEVRRSEGAKESAMYADNFLEVARQAKLAVEHGVALDKLDLDFDVVVGKARDAIKTAANHNIADRIIEKVKSMPVIGVVASESVIANGVAIGVGMATFLGRRAASSRAAAWLSFGGSALVGGAVVGAMENKRMKDDRAQHARERAQGRKAEEGSPRREEMEKYLHDMKSASELVGQLHTALGESGTMNPERATKAMDALADIEARIRLMDREKIDLISYSDSTRIEQERLELDLARAQTKIALRKLTGKDDITGGQGADKFLAALVDAKMTGLTEGDGGIEARDALFNKMKRKAVAKAAFKAVAVGLVVGEAGHEIGAYLNPNETGLFEQQQGSGTAHVTPLEGGRRALEHLYAYLTGHGTQSTEGLHHLAAGHTAVTLPESLGLHADGHGGFALVEDGKPLVEHLKLDAHGNFDPASIKSLHDHGITEKFGVARTEPMTTATVTANEYLDHHPKLGTHVSRDMWYDNDTPKPVFDKNELKLWWGGHHNTGLDADGKYTFSVEHMLPGGSYHHGLSANAQELLKEGKLKMLLSLSQGTQAHPVEVPIGADGNVHIDPKSEVGKLFFSTEHGKAHFMGRFAEVAQVTGTKDATDHVKILATYEGKGVDKLTDHIKSVKETPYITLGRPSHEVPNDFIIDPPPIIPIWWRTPLEPVNGRKAPNPFVPFLSYGSYGTEMTAERAAEYKKQLSEKLKQDPNAALDAQQEGNEYLKKQNPEYLKRIEAFSSQMEPMGPECKLAICIPVAGHQEGENIERTLSSYLNQTADPKTYEVVLFVNQPDTKPNGEKVVSDGTLEKIKKFKAEHPGINIRVMEGVLPRKDARIGNIRKLLGDTVLSRSLARGAGGDLIMVSNDADTRGVAPEYIANFVERFKDEKTADGLLGQLDWDPESYIRNPLVHVGTRLFQYMGAQYRNAKLGIDSSGASFAYRSSIYSAIGGYDPEIAGGEDSNFGQRIVMARQGSRRTPIDYAGARVSRLYTSSRRAEKAVKDGLAPIEQWSRGFGAFDDDVRKVRWEDTGGVPDYDDPAVVAKLIPQIENIVNRTLPRGIWEDPVYGNFARRSLGWLGIKYTIAGRNSIKITDASKLIEGLKQYSKDGMQIMERKTGARVTPAQAPEVTPAAIPESPAEQAPEPQAAEVAPTPTPAPVAEAPKPAPAPRARTPKNSVRAVRRPVRAPAERRSAPKPPQEPPNPTTRNRARTRP